MLNGCKSIFFSDNFRCIRHRAARENPIQQERHCSGTVCRPSSGSEW